MVLLPEGRPVWEGLQASDLQNGLSCSEDILGGEEGNIFLLKQTWTRFGSRMQSMFLIFKEKYEASETLCPPTWGAMSS